MLDAVANLCIVKFAGTEVGGVHFCSSSDGKEYIALAPIAFGFSPRSSDLHAFASPVMVDKRRVIEPKPTSFRLHCATPDDAQKLYALLSDYIGAKRPTRPIPQAASLQLA